MTDDKTPDHPPKLELVSTSDAPRTNEHENGAEFEGANDEAIQIKLSHLLEEHSDLDLAIHALANSVSHDRLAVARLKKKKLALKDLIQQARDALTPDIIA